MQGPGWRGGIRSHEHCVLLGCIPVLLDVRFQCAQRSGLVRRVMSIMDCEQRQLHCAHACAGLSMNAHTTPLPYTGQGLAAAAKAFLQVFATVWAGSQVTKLPRAGL